MNNKYEEAIIIMANTVLQMNIRIQYLAGVMNPLLHGGGISVICMICTIHSGILEKMRFRLFNH